MLEGKLDAVPPQLFTVNGSNVGLVTVADTAGFRIKQVAFLLATALPALPVQIKRVLSPTQLICGRIDNKIASWIPLDISAYTVAATASIGAEQQNKNNIPDADHYRAIYESDPVCGDRVINVDKHGQFYDVDNPLPVEVSGITIPPIEVAIDQSNDSILVYGFDGTANQKIKTDTNGLLQIGIPNTFIPSVYDDAIITRDVITQDITQVEFKLGGVTVKTVSLIYDANQNLIEAKNI